MAVKYAKRRNEMIPVLMDPDDIRRLGKRKLSIGSHGYAQTFENGRVMTLHSWIMGGTPSGMVIDHINRNKLDNRRSNLRIVSPTESNMNRVANLSSHGKGVRRQKSGRWAARLKRSRISYNLGTYDTPEQAAEAVKKFEAGPINEERAKNFRRNAVHTHTPAGMLKCRTCNPS